jgi:hypothetical protein
MYQEKHNKTRVVQFDSVAEFVRPKMENPNCVRIQAGIEENLQNPSARMITLEGWFGAPTIEKIAETLKFGDPKYVDIIKKGQIKLNPPKSIKRRKINGDSGDELDIHKINSGEFSTAWKKRSAKSRIGTKNIRLIINIGANCNVYAEQMSWRGVAALTIAEAFEEAGYNLAIDIVTGTTGITAQEDIGLFIPIKFYESPLDIQSLSSLTCFAGFFRISGFMNKGLAQGENFDFYGLGRSMETKDVRNLVSKVYTNPDEMVEIITYECLSQEAAKAEIQMLANKFI